MVDFIRVESVNQWSLDYAGPFFSYLYDLNDNIDNSSLSSDQSYVDEFLNTFNFDEQVDVGAQYHDLARRAVEFLPSGYSKTVRTLNMYLKRVEIFNYWQQIRGLSPRLSWISTSISNPADDPNYMSSLREALRGDSLNTNVLDPLVVSRQDVRAEHVEEVRFMLLNASKDFNRPELAQISRTVQSKGYLFGVDYFILSVTQPNNSIKTVINNLCQSSDEFFETLLKSGTALDYSLLPVYEKLDIADLLSLMAKRLNKETKSSINNIKRLFITLNYENYLVVSLDETISLIDAYLSIVNLNVQSVNSLLEDQKDDGTEELDYATSRMNQDLLDNGGTGEINNIADMLGGLSSTSSSTGANLNASISSVTSESVRSSSGTYLVNSSARTGEVSEARSADMQNKISQLDNYKADLSGFTSNINGKLAGLIPGSGARLDLNLELIESYNALLDSIDNAIQFVCESICQIRDALCAINNAISGLASTLQNIKDAPGSLADSADEKYLSRISKIIDTYSKKATNIAQKVVATIVVDKADGVKSCAAANLTEEEQEIFNEVFDQVTQDVNYGIAEDAGYRTDVEDYLSSEESTIRDSFKGITAPLKCGGSSGTSVDLELPNLPASFLDLDMPKFESLNRCCS